MEKVQLNSITNNKMDLNIRKITDHPFPEIYTKPQHIIGSLLDEV